MRQTYFFLRCAEPIEVAATNNLVFAEVEVGWVFDIDRTSFQNVLVFFDRIGEQNGGGFDIDSAGGQSSGIGGINLFELNCSKLCHFWAGVGHQGEVLRTVGKGVVFFRSGPDCFF